MNNKLIRLLLSVVIGLCLIIAGEWGYARYSRNRLLTSINSAKPQDYKIDELPQIELAKQPEQNYADLVARPLFMKGRRPVDEPISEAEQGVAAVPENFDWQLVGVYGTKKAVSGLFARSKVKVPKDNFRKITVGDELDGWKVTEINKDRAMLKQGSKEKELLLRKPKAKESSRQANQPAPPAPAPPPAPPTAIPGQPVDTTEDNNRDTSESNP